MHFGPGFQVQASVGWPQQGRKEHACDRERPFISAFTRRNRVRGEKITRSKPRNQCFASSCQPARSSRNCLCVALLPPADHVSTFSRSSLSVDDGMDVFVGIENVNGWTPAPVQTQENIIVMFRHLSRATSTANNCSSLVSSEFIQSS